jgi:hypothetical protein
MRLEERVLEAPRILSFVPYLLSSITLVLPHTMTSSEQ